MLRIFLFCLFFLGMPASIMFAQVNEIKNIFVCREVESKISATVPLTKVGRRVAYNDECEFYFYSNNDWFSIDIKKYKSLEESKKEFSSSFGFLTFDETYPKSVKTLKLQNFWDEAKGYHKRSDSDHLIMLRYKRVNFTLISSSYELLLKIEPSLRKIRFDNP